MISVLLAAEQCIDAAGVPLYHGLSKRSLLTLINSNQALLKTFALVKANQYYDIVQYCLLLMPVMPGGTTKD